MKAAGWEAAGDPHPAQADPLLWSGGPQGLHLAFILQARERGSSQWVKVLAWSWIFDSWKEKCLSSRRCGRTLAGSGKSWVRSCCNEALLPFGKAEKKMCLEGEGWLWQNCLEGKKSVKTAMLTFSNKSHFILSDDLEILAHSLLYVFASARWAARWLTQEHHDQAGKCWLGLEETGNIKANLSQISTDFGWK